MLFAATAIVDSRHFTFAGLDPQADSSQLTYSIPSLAVEVYLLANLSSWRLFTSKFSQF